MIFSFTRYRIESSTRKTVGHWMYIQTFFYCLCFLFCLYYFKSNLYLVSLFLYLFLIALFKKECNWQLTYFVFYVCITSRYKIVAYPEKRTRRVWIVFALILGVNNFRSFGPQTYSRDERRGPQVLPYMDHKGICREIGYGFWGFSAFK